jgi:hypothetical protein
VLFDGVRSEVHSEAFIGRALRVLNRPFGSSFLALRLVLGRSDEHDAGEDRDDTELLMA